MIGCMYLGVSRNWPPKIDQKKECQDQKAIVCNSYISCFGDFDPSLYQSWLCTVSRHYHGFKRVRHGVNSPILKFFLLFNYGRSRAADLRILHGKNSFEQKTALTFTLFLHTFVDLWWQQFQLFGATTFRSEVLQSGADPTEVHDVENTWVDWPWWSWFWMILEC